MIADGGGLPAETGSADISVPPRRSLRANSVHSISSSLFVAVGSVLFNLLLARVLGAEHRGALAFLLVVPTAVGTFASLGVRQSAAWAVGRGEHSGDVLAETLFSSALLISGLGALVGCVVMALTGAGAYGPVALALGAMMIIARILGQYITAIPLGRERIGIIATTNNLREAVRLALLPLGVVVLSLGMNGGLAAIVLAEVAVAAVLLVVFVLRPRIRLRFHGDLLWMFIRKGIVYATALLVFSLNYRADIWVVRHFQGDAVTGVYALGVTIVEALWLIPAALGLVLFARSTTSRDVAYMARLAGRILRLSILLAGVMGVGLLLLVRPAVRLLFGDEFAGADLVSIVLLPGVLISLGFKILNMDLAGRGRPDVSLKIYAPMLAMNILLNVLVVPRWGASGAALASTVTYSLGSMLFVLRYCALSGVTPRELLTYRRDDFTGLWPLRRARGSR